MFPKNFFTTSTNEHQVCFSKSSIELTKSESFISFLISGPSNTPASNFSALSLGNDLQMYLKHSTSLFRASTKCFMSPDLMCNREEMILSLETRPSLIAFCSWPLFLCAVLFCRYTVPHTPKTEMFCVNTLLTEQKIHHLHFDTYQPFVTGVVNMFYNLFDGIVVFFQHS